MSSNLFDGGRLVESRHCRELAKILSQDLERWNDFRSALRIPICEVQSLADQVREHSVPGESAFSQLVYFWISKCPKNATFGALIDILARQLEFLEAANQVMERDWT